MSVFINTNATTQYHATGSGVSHFEVKGARGFRLGDVLSVCNLVKSYRASALAFMSRATWQLDARTVELEEVVIAGLGGQLLGV